MVRETSEKNQEPPLRIPSATGAAVLKMTLPATLITPVAATAMMPISRNGWPCTRSEPLRSEARRWRPRTTFCCSVAAPPPGRPHYPHHPPQMGLDGPMVWWPIFDRLRCRLLLRAQVDFGAVATTEIAKSSNSGWPLEVLLRAQVDLGAAAQSRNASLPGCMEACGVRGLVARLLLRAQPKQRYC